MTLQQVLEIERHDTDDHRFAAAGIALAVCRDVDGARWRLDLPDGDAAERLTVPLGPDSAAPELPAEFAELVRGAARDRAVRPAGRVRTVRTSTRLLDDADRPLGTVVHDEVTIATLGRSTEIRAWTEVTVDAAAVLLAAVQERLADLGLHPSGGPAGEAELDGLLRPVPVRRAKPGRRASAAAVLTAHLVEQVDRLAAEDIRVRRDGPDAVHQLRVASRRLRSVVTAPPADGDPPAAQVRRPPVERGGGDVGDLVEDHVQRRGQPPARLGGLALVMVGSPGSLEDEHLAVGAARCVTRWGTSPLAAGTSPPGAGSGR